MPRQPKPDRHTISTRDGWRLAAYRHRRGPTRGLPVVLCHGLGVDRHNLDAPVPELSLAGFLADLGRDVWVVELRGAGRSRPPGWPLRRRAPFDFDDHVHRDAPALIRHVLDTTHTRSLHWVGHSMGGMLAYAVLEHYDARLFASVATVGSPAFTAMRHTWIDGMYRAHPLLGIVRWLPYRRLGQLASLNPWLLHRLVGEIAANPVNIDRRHLAHIARTALTDLPAPLLRQFAEWYGGEGFARVDGLLDYYDHLDRITAPLLFVAGAVDRLSPLEDIRFVYDAISSADKELLICGVAQGFSADYGHIDLIFGTRAREEVFPPIARWVDAHDR